ncbi:MAG: hypothetical protein HY909_20840 [Deltaproteobacteria bacterium]|nr:hypothetical protein [Deltaproteobacteria bacterium]
MMPLQFAMFARENSALRGEIAGLRGETAALRAEIIELRRVLVAATSVAISVSPAVPTIQDADLSSLVGNYLGVEDLDVRVALSTHPHLVKTLQEARARIAEYFGDDASVRLRAPSSEDAELFAQIRPRGLEVHEALDRMEDFSEKWWLLQPFEARRWLEFSVAWGA